MASAWEPVQATYPARKAGVFPGVK